MHENEKGKNNWQQKSVFPLLERSPLVESWL